MLVNETREAWVRICAIDPGVDKRSARVPASASVAAVLRQLRTGFLVVPLPAVNHHPLHHVVGVGRGARSDSVSSPGQL
eukprot:15093668-Heterocapsa_arctica.AAC.1